MVGACKPHYVSVGIYIVIVCKRSSNILDSLNALFVYLLNGIFDHRSYITDFDLNFYNRKLSEVDSNLV